MESCWRRLAPATLLVGFVFFVFAPVLFWGQAFFGEEQIGFYYAISHYVQESLQSGGSLLWNSAYYGGVSASLDQFVGAWYPLNKFLFSYLDLFTAHHLSIVIATALGLVFSYWFGRVQGWNYISSGALALFYLSATTYGWLQIGTLTAHSFMILPAILLSLWYAKEKRRYVLAVALGGAALGVGFLAGFVQIVFYAYIIGGFYALFLDGVNFERGARVYQNCTTSLSYVGMTLVGLLVGMRQFFPSAYLIDLTIRTDTYAIQHATHPNLTEFVSYVLPPSFSIPFLGGGASEGFYIGALGFIAAIVGLVYYRTRASLFFAGVYALIAAFAFHLPVFGWLNEHLPPFSHMGGNFRWMVAGAFPLAFVGAAGVEGLLRAPERVPKRAQAWVFSLAGVLTLVLLLGSIALKSAVRAIEDSPPYLQKLIAWYTDGRTLTYPLDHYVEILKQTMQEVSSAFSLSDGRFLFGVIVWVFAILALSLLWRGGAHRRFAPIIIATVLLFNVGGVYVLEWNDLVPQSLYRKEPALISFLKERERDPHAYRFFGFLVGDGLFAQVSSRDVLTPEESTILHREAVVNNSNLYWGLERMDGMEPYRTLRHNQLLHTVIAHDTAAYVFDGTDPDVRTSPLDQLYNRDVQKRVQIGEKLADLAKRIPLLSMMNVKYVYSPYRLSAPGLVLLETLTVPEVPAVSLYVYEDERVLPRLYFSRSQDFVAGEREAFLATAENTDFARATVIECDGCQRHEGGGDVVIDRYENGKVELTVSAPGERWLVFSESFMPGWEATVDGREVPIYRANYLFQAIHTPPGEHRVSFVYRDVTDVISRALF